MRKLTTAGALALLTMTISPAALAANVALIGSTIIVTADDSYAPGSGSSYTTTTSSAASVAHGGSSSAGSYSASSSEISITFDNSIPAPQAAVSETQVSVSFSVAADVSGSISGSFSVDPPGSSSDFEVWIYDLDGFDPVFGYFSFTIPGTTVSLLGGHSYLLYVHSVITDDGGLNPNPSAATGSGSVSLTFVPEPSTGAIVGLGFLGLAAGRTRSRGRSAADVRS